MGPQRAADIIRDAMFRGADGGYLLSGREVRRFGHARHLVRPLVRAETDRTRHHLRGPSGHRRRHGAGRPAGGREARPAAGDLCRGDPRHQGQDRWSSNAAWSCGTETVECPLSRLSLRSTPRLAECRPRNAKRVMTYKFALAGSEIAAAPESPAARARRRQALPADRRVGCRRRRSRPAAARPSGFAHEGQEDRERGFRRPRRPRSSRLPTRISIH